LGGAVETLASRTSASAAKTGRGRRSQRTSSSAGLRSFPTGQLVVEYGGGNLVCSFGAVALDLAGRRLQLPASLAYMLSGERPPCPGAARRSPRSGKITFSDATRLAYHARVRLRGVSRAWE
jgi:hypothetical protein